ncbi:MAG: hypothetical protein JXR48_01620 [Candidatus Delongbacteria bacterium]|nr:hypothetical protein [Candidatus Delongbacteria bacterium]MBN2833642.1 hypothetical protein [Candidatus Delongbacteria bacterium]
MNTNIGSYDESLSEIPTSAENSIELNEDTQYTFRNAQGKVNNAPINFPFSIFH